MAPPRGRSVVGSYGRTRSQDRCRSRWRNSGPSIVTFPTNIGTPYRRLETLLTGRPRGGDGRSGLGSLDQAGGADGVAAEPVHGPVGGPLRLPPGLRLLVEGQLVGHLGPVHQPFDPDPHQPDARPVQAEGVVERNARWSARHG